MGTHEESEPERAARRYQRTLFNDVAELYQATRPGYPRELVEFVAETAGLSAGASVLEVGCGTGQLTEHLAALGFRVTAIDLGPSMIEAARRKVGDGAVSFGIGAFEDLDLNDGSFDLLISGAAFHWIDPEVRFRKSARILRPGGWLAVVGNAENYDEPLRGLLEGMWAARGDVTGSWATRNCASTWDLGMRCTSPWSPRSRWLGWLWTRPRTRAAARGYRARGYCGGMPDKPGTEPELVRWVGIFFIACFLGLIPWTWYLAATLPDRQLSSHYNIAWTGFDVMLAVVLLATGICVLLRSPFLAVTAAAAACFLVIDAWFDIMTSPPGAQVLVALVMAAVAELPLAVACGWLSYRTEHLVQGKIDLFLGHTIRWR